MFTGKKAHGYAGATWHGVATRVVANAANATKLKAIDLDRIFMA